MFYNNRGPTEALGKEQFKPFVGAGKTTSVVLV